MPSTRISRHEKNVISWRQKLFWDYYTDPSSETYSVIYRSGIKAGYTPKTAENLSKHDWFRRKLNHKDLVAKAEEAFREMVSLDATTLTPAGKETKDAALARVKLDAAKYITERLDKDFYSLRTEMTGEDGEAPTVIQFNYVKPKSDDNPDDNPDG